MKYMVESAAKNKEFYYSPAKISNVVEATQKVEKTRVRCTYTVHPQKNAKDPIIR